VPRSPRVHTWLTGWTSSVGIVDLPPVDAAHEPALALGDDFDVLIAMMRSIVRGPAGQDVDHGAAPLLVRSAVVAAAVGDPAASCSLAVRDA
jgi:hypothetical protein